MHPVPSRISQYLIALDRPNPLQFNFRPPFWIHSFPLPPAHQKETDENEKMDRRGDGRDGVGALAQFDTRREMGSLE
jgi:hypothetical protein